MTLATPEEIRAVIVEQAGLPLAEVTETAELVADLALDELDMVELAMDLEERFELATKLDDFQEWRTVQDVIDAVRGTQKAAEGRG